MKVDDETDHVRDAASERRTLAYLEALEAHFRVILPQGRGELSARNPAVKVGNAMIWLRKPRYGLAERIPCKVIAIGESRVVIEVQTKDGRTVTRLVKPENLEER